MADPMAATQPAVEQPMADPMAATQPNLNCWLLELGGDVVDEIPCGPHERHTYMITVGGRTYEHTSTDRHGRWTYRPA